MTTPPEQPQPGPYPPQHGPQPVYHQPPPVYAAPPVYQQPPMMYQAPPEKKSYNGIWITVIIVGGLLALCFGSMIFGTLSDPAGTSMGAAMAETWRVG